MSSDDDAPRQAGGGGDDEKREEEQEARLHALEETCKRLEAQLKDVSGENKLLRHAMANMANEIEAVKKLAASGGGRRVGGRTPPRRRPPSAAKSPPQRQTPEKAETLPRKFGREELRKGLEAERRKHQDDSAVKSSASKRSSGRKATPSAKRSSGDGESVSRVLAVKTPDTSSKSDDIPADRRGKYTAFGKTIYYVTPEEFKAGNEVKAEAPSSELELVHAYGFNGREARDNLFFKRGSDESIVYSIAGAGVIQDCKENKQTFFLEHNEDILCMAVHPTREIYATGQLDPKGPGTPFICIWDENCNELQRFVFHDRGVIALAFSPDGRFLLSIGNDDNHEIALWNWEEAKVSKNLTLGSKHTPLLAQNCAKDRIFGAKFDSAHEAGPGNYSFVTYGVKHLKVWTISNLNGKSKERKLDSKKATTSGMTKDVQKAFHNVTFLRDGCFVVGTHSGDLYRFEGNQLVQIVSQAHSAIVGCSIVADEKEGSFVTAGDDGFLKVWDANMELKQAVEITGKGTIQPRSIAYANGRVVLGLKVNGILEVFLESGETKWLQQGHSSEVWGLAVHPTEPIVATAAHDKLLRLWRTDERCWDERQNHLPHNLGDKLRSAEFSPDGKYLVVGSWTGKLFLIDFSTMETVWEKEVAKETIDALAFSPDGSLVAAGSWDQFIHVVSVPEGKVLYKLKGHTASVVHLNFSEDGKFIMSDSRDYEILFWDVVKGKRVTKQTAIMDTKWSHWNCFLGWPVQGIWTGCGDGTDINAVDRNPNETVLAAGDDFGKVRLYKWPSMSENAPMKEYAGHSSHVPNVRFSADDEYLFSVGGADTATFQWKHKK